MPVSRKKNASSDISGAPLPFSMRDGTSIIQPHTAKVEALLSLRGEVYSINPNAIRKIDIVKLAKYAYLLCGLSKEERYAVVFAGEPLVKTCPVDFVEFNRDALENASEDVMLRSLRHWKFSTLEKGSDPFNFAANCHRFASSPKIKLLSILYNLESNHAGIDDIFYNILGEEDQYCLGALSGSPESARKLYWCSISLLIFAENMLELQNLKSDMRLTRALLYAEAALVPSMSSEDNHALLYFDNSQLMHYLQGFYSRLDSLRNIAQKVLES